MNPRNLNDGPANSRPAVFWLPAGCVLANGLRRHFARSAYLWITANCGYLHVRRQKLSPENMTRPGSYFCRTELSRDMFGPKYRDAGWFTSR
jgi:hypothetical protein